MALAAMLSVGLCSCEKENNNGSDGTGGETPGGETPGGETPGGGGNGGNDPFAG